MSFVPPNIITLGGVWSTTTYEHTSNGHYDLIYLGSISFGQSVEFTDNNGVLTLNVNPASGGGTTPAFFTIAGGSQISSGVVSVGDNIQFFSASGAAKGTMIVPDFYTGAGGSGSSSSTNKKVFCNFW
jgi:hypothetical protein